MNRGLLLSFGLTAALHGLTGCSVIGEEEATCPGAQSGVICASSREVYELSNYYNNAEDYALATGDQRVVTINNEGEQVPLADQAESNSSPATSQNGTSGSYQGQPTPQWTSESAYQHQLLPPPEPMAMRKPADIVRTLIRPYATSNDTLKIPGYSFIEAASRTWVIDRGVSVNNAQFAPLYLRKDSIEQEYTPSDEGEIGVDSRNGSPAKNVTPSPANLQRRGQQNALELMEQQRSSPSMKDSTYFK